MRTAAGCMMAAGGQVRESVAKREARAGAGGGGRWWLTRMRNAESSRTPAQEMEGPPETLLTLLRPCLSVFSYYLHHNHALQAHTPRGPNREPRSVRQRYLDISRPRQDALLRRDAAGRPGQQAGGHPGARLAAGGRRAALQGRGTSERSSHHVANSAQAPRERELYVPQLPVICPLASRCVKRPESEGLREGPARLR